MIRLYPNLGRPKNEATASLPATAPNRATSLKKTEVCHRSVAQCSVFISDPIVGVYLQQEDNGQDLLQAIRKRIDGDYSRYAIDFVYFKFVVHSAAIVSFALSSSSAPVVDWKYQPWDVG